MRVEGLGFSLSPVRRVRSRSRFCFSACMGWGWGCGLGFGLRSGRQVRGKSEVNHRFATERPIPGGRSEANHTFFKSSPNGGGIYSACNWGKNVDRVLGFGFQDEEFVLGVFGEGLGSGFSGSVSPPEYGVLGQGFGIWVLQSGVWGVGLKGFLAQMWGFGGFSLEASQRQITHFSSQPPGECGPKRGACLWGLT